MPHPAPLTIGTVRPRALDLVLPRPMETAAGTMRTTPIVLVDVETEEGVTGSSYVRCYTPAALGPLATLIESLDALLRGTSGAPIEADALLQRHFRLVGIQGLTGIAIAGVEMALWDALGKAASLPLATLLGGSPRAVPAYASLRSMRPHSAAEEAEELLALGFGALKVKIGAGSLDDDLATVRAVRAVCGDGISLMVDYNQNLSVAEAIRRGRVLDAEGLGWIEEPTRADDFEGHARIAEALVTPVQLGENWWGPHDMAKSLAARASDHAMLDVQKIGGVGGWLRGAALAEAASLSVSSHAFPEFSAHLLAVTPTALWLEYLDHVGIVLQEPVRVENGRALIPDRPGAGIAWNEDAIKHFSV